MGCLSERFLPWMVAILLGAPVAAVASELPIGVDLAGITGVRAADPSLPEAQVIRADGSVAAAKPGIQVGADDRIRTGVASRVTLRFFTGATATLDEQTQIRLDTSNPTAPPDIEVGLERGGLADVLVPGGVPFYVMSPTCTASVRAAVFSIRYDEQTGTTTISVDEGQVGVRAENPSLGSLLVGPGERAEVTRDRASLLPQAPPPKPGPPFPEATLRECETYTEEVCGTWTPAGDHFDAVWDNGMTAVITVDRVQEDSVVLTRRDSGPTTGLTAEYLGRLTEGGGIDGGTVTWSWQGRSWSGAWRADPAANAPGDVAR